MMKREVINSGTLEISVGKMSLEPKAGVFEYKNTDSTSDLNSSKNFPVLYPYIWQEEELPASIHQWLVAYISKIKVLGG